MNIPLFQHYLLKTIFPIEFAFCIVKDQLTRNGKFTGPKCFPLIYVHLFSDIPLLITV